MLYTVGRVHPYRGDGCSGIQGNRAAKTNQAEQETQRTREPHW